MITNVGAGLRAGAGLGTSTTTARQDVALQTAVDVEREIASAPRYVGWRSGPPAPEAVAKRDPDVNGTYLSF